MLQLFIQLLEQIYFTGNFFFFFFEVDSTFNDDYESKNFLPRSYLVRMLQTFKGRA